MDYVTLVPAYGRDYKSQSAVLEAWSKGYDFLIQDVHHPNNGSYINKSDAETHGSKPTTYNVRYKKLTMQVPIVVK